MSYTSQIDVMWLSLFDGIVIVAFLATLFFCLMICFRRGLDPYQSILCIFPVIAGYGADAPAYVVSICALGLGGIIFLGFVRLFRM